MANAFQKEGPVITPETAPPVARSERELWSEKLNESRLVRLLQFILFALVLQIYAVLSPSWGVNPSESFTTSFCVLCMTVALLIMYWQASGEDFAYNKNFTVSGGVILVHLGIVIAIYRHMADFPPAIEVGKLALPYIMAPLVTTVLLGPRMGTFASLAVSLLGVCFVTVDSESQAQYLVVSLMAGMLTVYITRNVRKRGQLLRAGFLVGLLILVMAFAMGIIRVDDMGEGVTDKAWSIALAFSSSFFLSILIGGVLPAVESFFKIITPVSWLEMTDMNHKLLKKLQLEAPGTFHHSIVVAQLAESAAEAIGANGNYCRVVSYYHDIGKVAQPQFFIENLVEGETNPHDGLTPSMSARIIIGHVSDGAEMAKENNLNRPIIDAIQQHHGTSLAYFFYRKALDYRKEMLEKVESGLARLDDVPEVVESNFRYKGPLPQNKEVGIVSLADIVESATRSLHSPSYEELVTMVNNVIKGRIVDGHLDESGLTFGDIHKVRDSFVSTLKNMRHARISYPKNDEDDQSPKGVRESAGTPDDAPPEPVDPPVTEEEGEEREKAKEILEEESVKAKPPRPEKNPLVEESIDEA